MDPSEVEFLRKLSSDKSADLLLYLMNHQPMSPTAFQLTGEAQMLAEIMQLLGHDGNQALAIEPVPDQVLLDIGMPGLPDTKSPPPCAAEPNWRTPPSSP